MVITSSKTVRTSELLESSGSSTVMRTLQCSAHVASRWVALHLVQVIPNVETSVSALPHRRQLNRRLKSSAKFIDFISTSRMSTALGKVTSGSGNSISCFIAVVEGVVKRRFTW